jgi:hypothetical protein
MRRTGGLPCRCAPLNSALGVMVAQARSILSAALWLPPIGWLRYVAVFWLAACTAVLCFSLWAYSPGPRSDAIVLFAWAMVALSFPAGLLVSLALAAVLSAADSSAAFQWANLPVWAGLPVAWGAFCFAGYAQWFVLVPRLLRRIRAVQATGSPTSNQSRPNDA